MQLNCTYSLITCSSAILCVWRSVCAAVYVRYPGTSAFPIGAAPNIIADWEQSGGDRFTVPVGIGINKTINIGKVPVRFGVEAMYSVHRPDNIPGARWDFRFYAIPAVPSAMFKWMQ